MSGYHPQGILLRLVIRTADVVRNAWVDVIPEWCDNAVDPESVITFVECRVRSFASASANVDARHRFSGTVRQMATSKRDEACTTARSGIAYVRY